MLLQHRLDQIASVVSSYEQEIAQLQARIREMQAHAQQIGSTESAMESAVQQLQAAIALINRVCPDEMEGFMAVVSSCFESSPIAELPAAAKPEPEDSDRSQTTLEAEPSEAKSEPDAPSPTSEPPTIDVTPAPTSTVPPEPPESAATPIAPTTAPSTPKPDYSRLDWAAIRRLAARHNVATRRRTREQIEAELRDKGVA